TFYNFAINGVISQEEMEDLYLLLSDTYFNMKDYVSASNEYRRFIQLYPESLNNDKALFYLAYSMENIQNNPDYKEAFRLYKLLVDKYPESKYRKTGKERMLHLERHYLKIN
ncbi:MAG TPA: outer membrane protein assembly factor BamD, partial [Spirochaetota bacterium]|nr:outer membrane protein assembly factor BamD [Spirochaetota bacterium]